MRNLIRKPDKISWIFVVSLMSFSLSSQVLGEEAEDTSAASDDTLEVVQVTATRRGETEMMSTPVAVTAITGRDIESLAPNDLNDISAMVPNLSSGNISAFKSASFAMRGVNEGTIIVYKESPVAVTIDDFVVSHVQTQNLEMFDIEQVEVLRGPQGTLFGKNTTGGTINVRTRRPDLESSSADVRLMFGDFGTQKTQLAVNLPIIEGELGFRFAGMELESDGYYEQGSNYGPLNVAASTGVQGLTALGDGDELGGDDVFSARAKLLWEPNENFSALLQYEIIRDDGESPPVVNESKPGYLFSLWGYGEEGGDPLKNAAITNRADSLQNMQAGHQIDIDGYYLNMDWTLDSFTLHSVTGYREQVSALPSTYTGELGPVSLFDATRDDERETFQQEIRLVSQLDGPFNFVTGVFHQTEDVDFCVVQLVGFVDLLLGTPVDLGLNNLPLILCNAQETTSTAIFMDGSYEVNDRMRISAGLRYTDEEKEWTGRPRIPIQMLGGGFDPAFTWRELGDPLNGANFDQYPAFVQRHKEDWSEPTYRLTVDYDFSENLFGYATYSRGFKSGGYNDQTGTVLLPIPDLALEPTDPEIADSFEVGAKMTLLDGSMNLSVTGFSVTYEDAQRTLNASFTTGQETLFFNAAELEVQGIEFEGAWRAAEGLTLRANASYQDAEFNEFAADTNFDGVIDIDLSNQPPTRAPEWMATISATYEHQAMGGWLTWNLRAAYEDESIANYSDVAPEFNVTLNTKTLVDASVTWESDEEDYYIRLIGRNLGDKRYRTGSLSVGNFWIMSSYGPPRFYGLEVGAKFD